MPRHPLPTTSHPPSLAGQLRLLEQDNSAAQFKGYLYHPFSLPALKFIQPYAENLFFSSLNRQKVRSPP